MVEPDAVTPPEPAKRTRFADAFQGPYFWPSLTALAGISIGSVDQYVVNTSMPRVLAELGQPVLYAWIASCFLLAQIVGMSLSGAWADRAGLRRPFLVAILVFGVGSMLCAASPSMLMLVLARGIQGLGAGGLSVLSYTAVVDYPEQLRIRMYSLISTLWGVVALGGPLLGGAITDFAGWRWIFLVNAPVSLIALAITVRGTAASVPSDRRRPLPLGRALLLAITAGTLVASPSSEPAQAAVLIALGLVFAWTYVKRERQAQVPVIPLETRSGRGPVGSSMLATMCITGAYTGAGVFLPLYLQNVRGESAITAGLVLSAGGVCWTVGSLISVHFQGESRKVAMRLGAGCICLGTGAIAFQVAAGPFPLVLITLSWVTAAVGVGVSLLHLMNWAIAYAPPDRSGVTSAAFQTCRILGSACGGALMGALLHGIGADPEHMQTSISAIFTLAAVIAIMPATLLRPKLPAAAAQATESGWRRRMSRSGSAAR